MARRKGPPRVQLVLRIHPVHAEMFQRACTACAKAHSRLVGDLIEQLDQDIRNKLTEDELALYDKGALDYLAYLQVRERARRPRTRLKEAA